MIIWGILFAIIILTSFFLAFRSMRNYHERPIYHKSAYSLYLIKNEAGLSEDLLLHLNSIIKKMQLIISFERLCKGSKKALVVYGPAIIIKQFMQELNLIELEDYTLENRQMPSILAWEISAKEFKKTDKKVLGFLEAAKDLSENEEIWWQIVTQPQRERDNLQPALKTLIRVIVSSNSDVKNQEVKKNLEQIIKDSSLLTLPQTYPSSQVLQFYQQRSLPKQLFSTSEGHFLCFSEDLNFLLS